MADHVEQYDNIVVKRVAQRAWTATAALRLLHIPYSHQMPCGPKAL